LKTPITLRYSLAFYSTQKLFIIWYVKLIVEYVYIIKKVEAKIYIAEDGRRSLSRKTAVIRSLKHRIKYGGILDYDGKICITTEKFTVTEFAERNRRLREPPERGSFCIDEKTKKLFRRDDMPPPEETLSKEQYRPTWTEVADLKAMLPTIKVGTAVVPAYLSEDGRRALTRSTAMRRTARRRMHIIQSMPNSEDRTKFKTQVLKLDSGRGINSLKLEQVKAFCSWLEAKRNSPSAEIKNALSMPFGPTE
jgi:hypothetical protein